MKQHSDIIDRSTGNIVGCISFENQNVSTIIGNLLARVASLARLVDQLETRLADLEDVVKSPKL